VLVSQYVVNLAWTQQVLVCFSLHKTANAEDLFGDADDISSVSSHGDEERGEGEVCNWVLV